MKNEWLSKVNLAMHINKTSINQPEDYEGLDFIAGGVPDKAFSSMFKEHLEFHRKLLNIDDQIETLEDIHLVDPLSEYSGEAALNNIERGFMDIGIKRNKATFKPAEGSQGGGMKRSNKTMTKGYSKKLV